MTAQMAKELLVLPQFVNAVGRPCIAKVVNKDGYSKLDAILPPLRQPARPKPPADELAF